MIPSVLKPACEVRVNASMLRVAILSVFLCCWTAAATAQISGSPGYLTAPIYGGTPGAPPPPEGPQFGVQKDAFTQRHLTPAGKPCVAINANAHAQIVNPNVYDHTLLLNNECSHPIKLIVCYYRTQNCKTFTTAAYKREQKLFGIATEKDFRFEFREYLN
jgi:hypothetical protein